MRNKYYWHSRISEKKFRQLIQCFSIDITAKETAKIINLNRRTVTDIYRKIRKCLVEECEKNSFPKSIGFDSLMDYVYENIARLNWDYKRLDKKARINEATISAVFAGRLKENQNIYTEIISLPSYDFDFDFAGYVRKLLKFSDFGIADFQLKKGNFSEYGSYYTHKFFPHYSIHEFWYFSKARLKKFNGLKSTFFNYYLKECEWRFNNNSKNLYLELLKMLRENPLDKSF